jgi:subtilisin-like proprotein convertase family protein
MRDSFSEDKTIMRSRPLFWFIICLLCLAGAYYFWQLGEHWAKRGNAPATPAETNRVAVSPQTVFQPGPVQSTAVSAVQTEQPGQTNLSGIEVAAAKRAERLRYRLANTTRPVGELVHDEKAILLENALFDTVRSVELPIPAHLRSEGDPGSYIVQSIGPLDDAYRALLRQAGAQVVSYIPNNAYLVRASASVAQQLAASPRTQSVLPYQPYYKLKAGLLKIAVDQEPLPKGSALNVLLFEDSRSRTVEEIRRAGGKVIGEDRSPFGTVLKVVPPEDALPGIARLPGVQGVELLRLRVPANDMTRVLTGVSPGSTNELNYLGLTGAGVRVNVNDGGVDAGHPDLSPRVIPVDQQDANGHGTHVAGIIASSGLNDGYPGGVLVSTNASGSATNADFRGMAPAAEILSIAFDYGSPLISDSFLQQTAAEDPEVFISNNSWGLAGENGYDLTAASYDWAVRDALPEQIGSRPLLFVFSAGNNGVGNDGGQSGEPDVISAPATAKNVIAVGATELGRFITNLFQVDGITNAYFKSQTDGTNQVASFSSRGNVGIGIEGEFGRFKPDVVAPGTFVVSTRSQQWNEDAYYDPSNSFFSIVFGVELEAGSRFDHSFFVPKNAARFRITLTNITSLPPLPTLPIYAKADDVPAVGPASPDFRGNNQIDVMFPPDQSATTWFYAVGNPTDESVNFDVLIQLIVTNNNNALEVLREMNDGLGGLYRYESGTSMSAAAMSGMLALMQEFLEQHNPTNGRPSAALMKAMVINGARSIGAYDFQVQSTINYQGWGLVNLTNSLPGALSNYVSHAPGAVHVYDQSPEEALVTGQSRTRIVTLDSDAEFDPLRVTLVWTDPPGNPAAGVKLVNDLDLVVSNRITGQIYYGNDIGPDSISNTGRETNEPPVLDVVNNVENIYIDAPSTNYTVMVIGRRVNVNAVTDHPNNVAQDYALVISSGDGRSANEITVTEEAPALVSDATTLITVVKNEFTVEQGVIGGVLLGQHVGANSPLLGNVPSIPVSGFDTNAAMTIGTTNQWHFYTFTNSLPLTNDANGLVNYAAFVTFLSTTLSIPREGVFEPELENATREEADIDLFVSTSPAFTNLDPVAVANATKSQLRGGTEVLVFTNTVQGQVYYIGVKAEDRQAAEYGFLAVASLEAFSFADDEGVTIRGLPVPQIIPDGTPRNPGRALVFGIAVSPDITRRVIVTNTIGHELFGDLLGHLAHNRRFAVLNNHTDGDGTTNQTLVYEDNGEGAFVGSLDVSRPSDGPGSLRNFVGESIGGLWLLTMVDDALFERGTVRNTTIRVERMFDFDEGGTNFVCLPPGRPFYYAVDVPVEATSLTNYIVDDPNAGNDFIQLELSARRDAFPTATVYDKAETMDQPVDFMVIDKTDDPPLNAGRYFFRLFNSNTTEQCVGIAVFLGKDLDSVQPVRYSSTGFEPILDDAVGYSTIFVTNNQRIATVDVGLRIEHPRISDLAITLVSPSGTRVLLMENRGGTTTAGAGTSLVTTNVFPVFSAGTNNPSTNILITTQNSGTLFVSYDFEIVPDILHVYYDGNLIFDSGPVSGAGQFVIPYGPGLSSDLVLIMNEGGNVISNTVWSYTASVISSAFTYLNFTENTNLTLTPIKFALPPFSAAPTGSALFSESFEGYAMTPYTNGQIFGVWMVQTNHVTITNAPPPAHSGSQFLVLGDGQVETSLPTTAGKRYRLEYAYRTGYIQENLAPADDLVAWWPGQDNAIDIVGGHNGTFVGGNYVNGLVNRAFSFPGASGRIMIPYSSDLAPTDYTIEAWIRPMAQVSNPQNQALIFGQSFGHLQLVVRTGTTGVYVALQFGTDQTTFYGVQSTDQIPLGSFTHVAGTWDGTTLRLYIDGALNNQETPGAIPDDPGCNFFIGGFDDPAAGYCQVSPSQFFNGVIDEVSLYRRALTLPEIQSIYAIGAAGKCAMATPPAICSGVIAGPAVNPANGHRYLLLNSNNWSGSEMWAQSLGAHLVTINDAAENNWIVTNFAAYNSVVRDLWIGLNDITQEANFVWTSGEPFIYSNWQTSPLQPDNNAPGPGEDWVHIYNGGAPPWVNGFFTGGWNDYRNDLTGQNLPSGFRTFNGVVELPAIPGRAQISLQGVTNDFTGDTNWQSDTLGFTAQQSGTPLVVRGVTNGVAVDSFSLFELGQGLYYLPEESLEVLKGENAFGEWRLEIWDNRTGSFAPIDSLQSWQLSFIFEDLSLVTRVTNTICGGEVTNILIKVPANAAFASNVLISATGPVNVFFNQLDLATGNVPPDSQVLTASTNGTFLLTPFTTPPLVPGATYRIGVQNPGTNCVTFVYQVAFGFSVPFPAFPGAEGPGIAAWGGRGGDVYHVVNLNDSGPGSLRHGITSASGRRTIVFDLSGTINLLSDLVITNRFLTIAGQTAPGDGITLRGRLTSVQNTHDVVIRFLRFRPGDTNCPTFQDDSFHFDFASNCIVDHVSASWSIDEVLSATDSTNVTVQWSLITEALNDSCHTDGLHGYGSLVRYGAGEVGYHHNLYAHNYSRNPRLGDNLSLDFVNNVIYNWGDQAGYSEDDTADNPNGFTNRLNYVGNYLIAGTNSVLTDIAFDGGSLNTWIHQSGNVIDDNRNGVLDGLDTGFGMFANLYTPVPTRFDSLPLVTTHTANEAYERVLAFGGAWQNRDTVDLRLVNDVRLQTNGIIDSQNAVGGWPTLNSTVPFPDTDQDGMPDFWEVTLNLNPLVAGNNLDRNDDGYTDLEEHINWLAVPHALTVTNTPVDVDLRKVTGNTGNLAFNVFNGTNGTVVLLTNGFTARFTPAPNYFGFASFGFTATNLVTANRFGPVPVSVFVSKVTPAIDFRLRIIRWQFVTNSFCVTWNSIPGSNYVVQAKPDLSVTNWDTVSPVIQATDYETTWCLPLPSVYHFFRVAGIGPGSIPPDVAVPINTGDAYCATNSGVGNTSDYYRFTVSSNSVRAQFEINGPTGDMTLAVRKGFVPDLITYDYISANSGTNDELIVVYDYSSPVALSPGDWYLAAINVSGGPVSYCIKASEWTSYGTNFAIIRWAYAGNNFCVTWNSLAGVHYVVEGRTNLSTSLWTDVSPTVTAITNETTWCLALPSPYQYFRVREGLSTNQSPVVPPIAPVISSVAYTNGSIQLRWNGPPSQQYQVQWTTNVVTPVTWSTVAAPISSGTGQFVFIDDGSQTAPLGLTRFYRLRLFP